MLVTQNRVNEKKVWIPPLRSGMTRSGGVAAGEKSLTFSAKCKDKLSRILLGSGLDLLAVFR